MAAGRPWQSGPALTLFAVVRFFPFECLRCRQNGAHASLLEWLGTSGSATASRWRNASKVARLQITAELSPAAANMLVLAVSSDFRALGFLGALEVESVL